MTISLVTVIPMLVAIISAVLYLLVTKSEVKSLALYAFATSFLVVMFGLAGHVVRIGAP